MFLGGPVLPAAGRVRPTARCLISVDDIVLFVGKMFLHRPRRRDMVVSIRVFESDAERSRVAQLRRWTIDSLVLVISVWAVSFEAMSFAATDIVISTGVASPDGNGVLSIFNAPSINSAGQLAFVSYLTGTSGGTADDQALYRLDTGSLAHIARKGQIINSRSVTLFFSPYLDSAGTICDVPALGFPATFTHVFSSGGPLTLMYAPGSSSPTGNNTLLGVTSAAVNDAGGSAYLAAYTGTNVEVGLYSRASNGSVNTLVLRNSNAPRGGTISGLGARLTLNETGQVAGLFSLSGTTSTKSIVRVDGTGVHELVRRSDVLSDGVTTIGDISTSSSFVQDPIPIINDAGQVAFPAQYTQPVVARFGVFVASDSGTQLVAPGNLPQGNMNNINVVGLSAAGRVAFTTDFVGGSDPISGVYLADTSGPTLIALEDTATPVPGKFFRTFYSTATTLNSAGQLAFVAELSDTANGPAAGRGLFFYDPTTGLQQIARTGDILGGGIISDIYFNGTTVNAISVQSPDTSLSGLNSAGKVAFAYSLTNSQSGIAVWSPTNIPGDYNGDTVVDSQDYTAWRAAYGTSQAAADGNQNGSVDAADYVIWRRALNAAGAGAGGNLASGIHPAVPEPAALLSIVIGLAMFFLKQRDNFFGTRRS